MRNFLLCATLLLIAFSTSATVERSSHRYMEYDEFNDLIQTKKIKSRKEYVTWRKENNSIYNKLKLPSNPNHYYKEWESWGKTLETKPFPTFEQFIQIVKENRIPSSTHYKKWRKENNSIYKKLKLPSNPNQYYKEWKNWDKILETKPFPTFEQFTQIVRENRISSSTHYRNWREENNSIYKQLKLPSNPNHYYKEWENWDKILETKPFPTFEQFTQIVRENRISSSIQYRNWRKEIGREYDEFRLHSLPASFYKKEWLGWKDLLQAYIIYQDLKEIVRELEIKTEREFRQWRKGIGSTFRGKKIPSNPDVYYEKTREWENWDAFLGKSNCQKTFENL